MYYSIDMHSKFRIEFNRQIFIWRHTFPPYWNVHPIISILHFHPTKCIYIYYDVLVIEKSQISLNPNWNKYKPASMCALQHLISNTSPKPMENEAEDYNSSWDQELYMEIDTAFHL